MMSSLKESSPYVENIEKIESNGVIENATLTNIEPIENININDNHPKILTYEFDLNGEKIQSKFSVFNPKKTESLNKGDTISVKHLNGNSIVLGYEQYSFTMDFMYYITGAVLFVGLILCYLLYSRIMKELELYKTGRIEEAKIISTSQNKGFTFSKFGRSMDVHYEFKNKVYKSRTNNFAITNNKSIGDKVRILVSKDGESSCLYPELIAKMNRWEESYVA